MQLVMFALEMRFKDSGRPFNWRQNLMQTIAGSAITEPTPNPINDVIEVELTNQKTKVVIETNRFAIGVEECNDIEQLKSLVCKLTEKVASSVDWHKTLRFGIRTIWAEDVNDTFDNLVKKIKDKSFISNPILDSSNDVALSFTLLDGKNKVNYNAGAMKKEELIQRYALKSQSLLPEISLVTDVDYFTLEEMDFKKNNVKSFFETALKYSDEKAKQTVSINL